MTEHLPECPWFPNTHEDVTCRDAETLVTFCEVIAKVHEETLNAAVQRVMELPDLLDAGFTYSGLLHRETAIDALRRESDV